MRSLAGRAARLGDGYSRNPEDRDQLLAQRTKDLSGLIGQLRGFSLEEFLSDASAEEALAWSVGQDVLPDRCKPDLSKTEVAAHVAHLGSMSKTVRDCMHAAGVSSELKALYVPDYVDRRERIEKSSVLHRVLRTAFPECDVKVALAEPPFEDLEGNGCHFEKQGKQKLSGKKLANATRVDLLTSLATLLREVARHRPSFVIGTGQGGIIALAAASPVVVESVLLARNVHISEAQKIANAWSKIKLLVGVNPRISKSKPGTLLLQEACPEWFSPHPLECLPRLGLVEQYAPAKEEIGHLLSATGVIQIGSLSGTLGWKGRAKKFGSMKGYAPAIGGRGFSDSACNALLQSTAKEFKPEQISKQLRLSS